MESNKNILIDPLIFESHDAKYNIYNFFTSFNYKDIFLYYILPFCALILVIYILKERYTRKKELENMHISIDL